MITQLTQEAVTEYASDAQTIQEPQGADYSQGVKVGRTVPAKWWNWLFRAATKRLGQSRTDAQNMLTELQNVVTDAGITLDGSDSTQLTQAIANDVNTQIDKYVFDKRGFMTLWGKHPIPDDFFAYMVEFQYQIEGLYFLVLRGYADTGGHGTSIKVVVSDDMVNWKRIATFISYGSVHGGTICCKYFAGAWYLLLAVDNTEAADADNLFVYRTFDKFNWEQLFQAPRYNLDTHTGVLFDVLEDSLYLAFSVVNGQNLIYRLENGSRFEPWTDHGTNLFFTAPANSTPITGFSLPSPAIRLGAYKYLAGCFIIYPGTVSPSITNIAPSGIACFSDYDVTTQAFYYGGTNVRKMIGGGYALLSVDSSDNIYVTICDDSGTVVRQVQPFNNDAVFLKTSPLFPTYLFRKRTSGGATNFEYSSDGFDTYKTLPFPSTAMLTQTDDGTFYVAVSSGATDIIIYSIYGQLSEDIEDYTLVTQFTPASGNNIDEFGYGGVSGTLVINQISREVCLVSVDNGQHWKVSKFASGEAFNYVYAYMFTGDAAYTKCTGQLYAYSGNGVNRVEGHTLYLR